MMECMLQLVKSFDVAKLCLCVSIFFSKVRTFSSSFMFIYHEIICFIYLVGFVSISEVFVHVIFLLVNYVCNIAAVC